MLGSRHEKASFQSDFYRDQFRKLLRWLIVAIVVIFILIAAIIYFVLFAPPEPYYISTTEGRVISISQHVIR
ncbi:MAG: hypothetical protein A3F12_06900 [Gammaproteobacteria bacterium RIFCSPHIGHO2_12_FULL_38_14]|nr:MAG: hypothetical protein A3F12_06900 [Gammaproteobacteria bacterium RIFCSPHIGHO2_12_FULL_38_14]